MSDWRGRSTATERAAADVPTPRLAGSRNLGVRIGARPAARSSGAVVRPAPAKARADERRRLGRRLFRRRRAPAVAQRCRRCGGTSRSIRSHRHCAVSCVVAAVRSATVGMPIEASATAPFTDGQWLLSHNGVVDRDVLPTLSTAESTCDSAILAALIFESRPRCAGADDRRSGRRGSECATEHHGGQRISASRDHLG